MADYRWAVDSLAQSLSGWQKGREILERKQRQKNIEAYIVEKVKRGDLVPTVKVSSDGDYSITFKESAQPKEITPGKQILGGAAGTIPLSQITNPEVRSRATTPQLVPGGGSIMPGYSPGVQFPNRYTPVGEAYGITKNEAIRKQAGLPAEKAPKGTFSKSTIEKVVGELESGGRVALMTGQIISFADRQAAIDHVMRKLGPNWEQISPKAKEVIDRKWPVKGKTVEGNGDKYWWRE